MTLVLLSGAGMLAFALVDLWGAVRDADEVAQRDAREKAERIGRRLTELLASPDFIESLPKLLRFELRDGVVFVPPEVGWLLEPPAPYAEVDLPIRAGVLLQRARRAEVVDRDNDRAEQLLAEALATPDLTERDRVHLLVEAGWQASRFDQNDRVIARWRALAVSPGLDMRAAASALMLARSNYISETANESAFRRLRQLASALPEDAGVEVATEAPSIVRRRRILEAVASMGGVRHGARLAAVAGLDQYPKGGWTVLVHGETPRRSGALVWNPALQGFLSGFRSGAHYGRSPIDPVVDWLGAAYGADWNEAWAEQVVNLSLKKSKGAVVVTASLAVEPVITPTPFWANPVVLIVLLLVLAICFGAGLFFSFRAIFRESAAMRARADFLTSVTHELKTPLSSIRLLSEMLEEGRVSSDDKKSEYYRLLAGESARLTVLIENVLDLGRMERGERAYDLRTNAVDDVVEEATRVFEPIANRDGLQLKIDLAADGRLAQIDRGAFVQALLNVMENARKYAIAGGKLEVRSRGENGTYFLSVRDHGPGIAATERETIFDRFARGTEQKNGAIAGVGLGLYLARTILRAHNGDLQCVAPQDGGAEFVFSIPLSEPS